MTEFGIWVIIALLVMLLHALDKIRKSLADIWWELANREDEPRDKHSMVP